MTRATRTPSIRNASSVRRWLTASSVRSAHGAGRRSGERTVTDITKLQEVVPTHYHSPAGVKEHFPKKLLIHRNRQTCHFRVSRRRGRPAKLIRARVPPPERTTLERSRMMLISSVLT